MGEMELSLVVLFGRTILSRRSNMVPERGANAGRLVRTGYHNDNHWNYNWTAADVLGSFTSD